MKKVNYVYFLLFGLFLALNIAWNPVLAQIPTDTGISINTPINSATVPSGELTIYGTSSDDDTTNCQVYTDWNDQKPMQNVTANGPNGNTDYSKWSYTYTTSYHNIVEGPNELTSKITCYGNDQNATSKYYSINVTGVKAKPAITNDTVQQTNDKTDNEPKNILPVTNKDSNNPDNAVQQTNDKTDNEPKNILPITSNKNGATYKILPLYSESQEESTKAVISEDSAKTQISNTNTITSEDSYKLQDLNTSNGDQSDVPKSTTELDADTNDNTYFTYEPILEDNEGLSNNHDVVVGSSTDDNSISSYNHGPNSIFGLKFKTVNENTKNNLDKRVEKLENSIDDSVHLFDLIG